jgi:hypothetical protein
MWWECQSSCLLVSQFLRHPASSAVSGTGAGWWGQAGALALAGGAGGGGAGGSGGIPWMRLDLLMVSAAGIRPRSRRRAYALSLAVGAGGGGGGGGCGTPLMCLGCLGVIAAGVGGGGGWTRASSTACWAA